MANARTLRKEASSLLKEAKKAFKFIRDNPAGPESQRQALLKSLQEVIDRADPPVFDENLTTIKLTMTNPSADAVLKALSSRDGKEDADALDAVSLGLRRTAQRAYIRLELNPSVLRHICYVLRHTTTKQQDKVFERLANEIEEGVATRNPMEILGRMGL